MSVHGTKRIKNTLKLECFHGADHTLPSVTTIFNFTDDAWFRIPLEGVPAQMNHHIRCFCLYHDTLSAPEAPSEGRHLLKGNIQLRKFHEGAQKKQKTKQAKAHQNRKLDPRTSWECD